MVIAKGSRYESAREFASANGKEPLFGGVRPRKITSAAGVLEYTVNEGDRLDLLSLHFYNNTRRWWRILDANPQLIFGADLMLDEYIGETILIPRSTETGGGQ
jgi:nucleoid-associated protein YgaU